MKKSLIYTRTGDKGYTSLNGEKRIKKTHLCLEAVGTIDELNANIGWLATIVKEENDKTFLMRIQHNLFTLGGFFQSKKKKISTKTCHILEEIILLEKEIDQIDSKIPPLSSFILPGGCQTNASAHICRTVCRRAERRIVLLIEEEILHPNILKYINRLSDYFFLFARKQSFIYSSKEIKLEKFCK